VYLANDVLVKVDRMSMQHGLEVRCPLLDHRLVELAFRLPQSIKRADRRGKHLLKRVAAKRLPAALVRAPKHGFSAPVGSWLRGRLARRFQDEVLRKSSHVETIVNASYIRRAFVQHQRGESDQSSLLWLVWVLERWAAAGLGPASPPAANMDQPLELSGRVGS
jgi:asparagine synthase (glutamine-hydrolysing)